MVLTCYIDTERDLILIKSHSVKEDLKKWASRRQQKETHFGTKLDEGGKYSPVHTPPSQDKLQRTLLFSAQPSDAA